MNGDNAQGHRSIPRHNKLEPYDRQSQHMILQSEVSVALDIGQLCVWYLALNNRDLPSIEESPCGRCDGYPPCIHGNYIPNKYGGKYA